MGKNLSKKIKPVMILVPGMEGTGKLYKNHLLEFKSKGFDSFIFEYDKTGPQTIIQHAEALARSIENFKGQKIYLCGHSMGGCIILELIKKHSKMLSGIILINSASAVVPKLQGVKNFIPSIKMIPNPVIRFSAKVSAPLNANKKKFCSTSWNNFKEVSSAISNKLLSARLKAISEFNYCREFISKCQLPVLVISSLRDNVQPSLDEAKTLASHFPNSDLRILGTSGHDCLNERNFSIYSYFEESNIFDKSNQNILPITMDEGAIFVDPSK
ncbi:MAG: alpha/beta hydrolase [Oligoflexales bacterium]